VLDEQNAVLEDIPGNWEEAEKEGFTARKKKKKTTTRAHLRIKTQRMGKGVAKGWLRAPTTPNYKREEVGKKKGADLTLFEKAQTTPAGPASGAEKDNWAKGTVKTNRVRKTRDFRVRRRGGGNKPV